MKYLKPDCGTDDEDALRSTHTSTDASVRNMANAVLEIRRYFRQQDSPRLEDFFTYFRTKVLLIYVASTQLEDAFRLFTVLNDRGMKLRNSDILKALNLRELKETNISPREQQQAARMWEELEGELGEEFDVFLAHLRTILVKEKARLGLLQEFEENIYKTKQFGKETKRSQLPALLKVGRETFEFIERYRKHYLQIFSGNNHHLANSWEFRQFDLAVKRCRLGRFLGTATVTSSVTNELWSSSDCWRTSSQVIGLHTRLRQDASKG